TDVFVSNEPVRRLVRTARNGKATDVLLWGRRRPAALTRRLVPVRHRPSAAAQVFKSHALAARGAFVTEPAEEFFYSMTCPAPTRACGPSQTAACAGFAARRRPGRLR